MGFYDGKFFRGLLAQFVNEWKQILGMELVIKLSINAGTYILTIYVPD